MAKALHKQLKISGLSLLSCPIWKNPLFIAGGKPLNNDVWRNKNIAELGHMFKSDGDLVNFHELKIKFGLNNSNIFQYLQIKSIMSNFTFRNIAFINNEFIDNKLKDAVSGRGNVSKLYRLSCSTFSNYNESIKAQ